VLARDIIRTCPKKNSVSGLQSEFAFAGARDTDLLDTSLKLTRRQLRLFGGPRYGELAAAI
jgi:hypothetical protein